MKRKGAKSDFTRERNEELRAAFFSQKAYAVDRESLRRLAATPASRFWVDPERARDVMSSMERRPDALRAMKPQRRRMYEALYSRYSDFRTRNPEMTKIQCVSMAIFSGAPEFFISPKTAQNIIYSRLHPSC